MARGPQPGGEWAGHRIEAQIGEGGFGRVFSAWDPTLERRVAIKVLHRDGLDVDASTRERFLRESRMAAGLDHPRIVPIHSASEYRDPEDPDGPTIPYLVMRYVDGGDLRSELRQGPLGLARTQEVTTQIADALDRAHRSNLVHRDVKPANILCSADSGDVYLGDFGITRVVDQPADAGLTATGQVPMSPHYAAPEQLAPGGDRGPLGPATDVYSLGCTVFECLTGRVPFPGANHVDVSHQHLHASRPTVTRHRPDLPTALDVVLAEAMAIDPADRYGSAGDFAAALAAIPAGGAAGTSPGVVPPIGMPGVAGTTPTTVTPDADATVLGDGGPRPGATVFTPTGSPTGSPAGNVDGGLAGDATRAVPVVADAPVGPPPAATGVYEVEWDGWEEERPPSRTPWVVGGVLVLVLLVVGALVVRAVNTGAELDTTAATTTTTSTTTAPEPVTEERLRGLLPAGLEGCVPPAEAPPDDIVQLVCPRTEDPDLVAYTLFADVESRDQAFEDSITGLELDPASPGDCALAVDAVHDYVGIRGEGRLACRTRDARVDLVWTEGGAPVLAAAGGNGFYGRSYRFWESLVQRSDADFPLPQEQDLLDDLPTELLAGCRRDIDLTDQAPGIVAIACDPAQAEPDLVSWVRFRSGDDMVAWIDARQRGLEGLVVDTTDDACTPEGFGVVDVPEPEPEEDEKGNGKGKDKDDDDDDEDAPPPPPTPEVGATNWELDGSTGRILCFVNSSDQNVLFWTRDGSLIGSIAVSSAADDLPDLLAWFEDTGYRP